MTEPLFTVPSIMFGGSEPLLPPPDLAPTVPPLAGRGGALTSVADVEAVLWQLDPVLLLLELAGYEASELAIAIPATAGGPAPTIPLDLSTSMIGSAPGHAWTPATTPAGAIGLWVGPRANFGAVGGSGDGLHEVDLSRVSLQPAGTTRAFTSDSAGWLSVPLVEGAAGSTWQQHVATSTAQLSGSLRDAISAAWVAAGPDAWGTPSCGMLPVLRPLTWIRGETVDAGTWDKLGSELVATAGRIYDQLLGDQGIGIETFLVQESSSLRLAPFDPYAPDPEEPRQHSASERVVESIGLDPGAAWLLDEQSLAGSISALRSEDGAGTSTLAELRSFTWTETVLRLQQDGVIDALGQFTTDRYGGFSLQYLDSDAQRKWGGVVHTLPAGGAGGYVGDLQRDLRALGFAAIAPGETDFGVTTEWAVREFQVYAAMDTAARRTTVTTPYADGLQAVAVPADSRYAGLATGLVDRVTRDLIGTWLSNGWVCPVVAEARRKTAGQPVVEGLDNVWRFDQVTNTGFVVHVRDFSGAYDLPAAHPAPGPHVVGRYDKSGPPYSGPLAWPSLGHTWAEGEFLPDVVDGVSPTTAGFSPARLSTYKVIRIVAEIECYGYLDSINAYDRAIVSLGPNHQVFGLMDGSSLTPGELAGLVAYFEHQYPAAFDRAIGRFGLKARDPWGQSGQTYLTDQHKYVGWFSRPDARTDWSDVPKGSTSGRPDVLATNAIYRSWPSTYRWQMAGRTIPEWRQACWDMARIRVRDMLAAPWGPGLADIQEGGQARPVTIGDVFRSERAVAMLHRWHVKSPAHVVKDYKAATNVRRVLDGVVLPDGQPPSAWPDTIETSLIANISTIVNDVGDGDLKSTLERVRTWPDWGGAKGNPQDFALDLASVTPVHETRQSNPFTLDTTGLPPPPRYSRT